MKVTRGMTYLNGTALCCSKTAQTDVTGLLSSNLYVALVYVALLAMSKPQNDMPLPCRPPQRKCSKTKNPARPPKRSALTKGLCVLTSNKSVYRRKID